MPAGRIENGRRLAFLSATTVLGTAADVMLAEAMLETFLPADADTAMEALSTAHPACGR